jgi:hypothetical protein
MSAAPIFAIFRARKSVDQMSRQFSLVLKVTHPSRLNASLLMALAFLCVLAFWHSADKTSKTDEHGKEMAAYGRPHSPRFVADIARELVRLHREPAPVHGSDELQEGIPMIRRFRVPQFA